MTFICLMHHLHFYHDIKKDSQVSEPVSGGQNRSRKFLYITFDDGPNFGSHVVLDAFKTAGRKLEEKTG